MEENWHEHPTPPENNSGKQACNHPSVRVMGDEEGPGAKPVIECRSCGDDVTPAGDRHKPLPGVIAPIDRPSDMIDL